MNDAAPLKLTSKLGLQGSCDARVYMVYIRHSFIYTHIYKSVNIYICENMMYKLYMSD